MVCMVLTMLTQYPPAPFQTPTASGPHPDLSRAPYCYVVYGVKYIDLVSPRTLSGLLVFKGQRGTKGYARLAISKSCTTPHVLYFYI